MVLNVLRKSIAEHVVLAAERIVRDNVSARGPAVRYVSLCVCSIRVWASYPLIASCSYVRPVRDEPTKYKTDSFFKRHAAVVIIQKRLALSLLLVVFKRLAHELGARDHEERLPDAEA